MTEFADLRAALKTNLDTINAGDDWIEISPYQIANPSPPMLMIVGIRETDYDVAFGGDNQSVTVLLLAVAGTITDLGPQQVLDRLMMGADSVQHAVETDKTLGGRVDDLRVTHLTGHREFPLGSQRVYGAEWTVQIELADS